jgi:threonyl-tRNA synthetase
MGVFMQVIYNEKKIELPLGATAKDLAEKVGQTAPNQAIVAKINGSLRDLSTPLQEGDTVILCNFEDPTGKEVFWHSSAHVLAQAIVRLFPEALPTIGPPIEQGFYYDFANLHISEADFARIEEEVEKILKENFRPERQEFTDKKEALAAFKANPYKTELISSFEGLITGYKQGEFFDLCRGPHLPALGKIKAFKILKTSGAYWRADKEREMLTRVYAISFPDRKALKEYLHMLEEAKKRDHKILGPKLGLFSIKEEAPGMPFIHPKGMIIWNRLIDFLRTLQQKAGYVEIKTPQLMSRELWQRSGHWDHYRENMYAFDIEGRHYALKPMNCPGCMLFYGSQTHSYRELPLRISEFGHVHRHEASGALSGLFRVRSFHQDDTHIFMRPSDIKNEILSILRLAETIYSTFGLDYRFELSTRPEKSIGSDEEWELATSGLKNALDESGLSYRINEGDGAFYGPKIDIHIRDALGRSWQCGTVQLDMALPEKFALEYVDSDGAHKRPVMIHRAIFGSVERFFGILIEHFAGKFPFWISPLPIRLLPIADRHLEYAKEVAAQLEQAHLICDIDQSHESVSKKVREAQLLQINYMLILGDKELEQKTLSIRRRDNVLIADIRLEEFVQALKGEMATKALSPVLGE